MRAMWLAHGKPGGPQPGLVAKPYTLKDARDRLAEVVGDRAFADEFFDQYIEGREVPDYATAPRAGRDRAPQAQSGRAWWAALDAWTRSGAVPGLVRLEHAGVRGRLRPGRCRSLSVDGKPLSGGGRSRAASAGRKPGDRVH